MPFWGGGGREKEEAIPRHLPLPTGPYAVGYQVSDLISPLFPAGRMFGLITQKGLNKKLRNRTSLRQGFGHIFPNKIEDC
jgi:hypothetical protein